MTVFYKNLLFDFLEFGQKRFILLLWVVFSVNGCCFIPYTFTHILPPGGRSPLMTPSQLNRGGPYFYSPFYGSFQGSLYVDRKGEVPEGLKKGQACATNIAYIFTTGDASFSAAAEAGGIRKILYVDYEATNIFLGTYQKYCLIVWGLP